MDSELNACGVEPAPREDGGEARTFAGQLRSWNDFHPRPRIELDSFGRVFAMNPPSDQLRRGLAFAIEAGRLRFGSDASNRVLEQALRAGSEKPRQKLVLQGLDGAWRAAALYADPSRPTRLLVFTGTGELRPDGFSAVAAAFELTRGETRVLEGLCDGLCARDIAKRMNISEHTVRSHLRAVYEKFGVRRVSNIVRMAIQLSI